MKWEPFGHHLVDFGRHFGAHRILKGPQKQWFSYKINIKCEKRWPGAVPDKTKNSDGNLVPEREATKGKKEVFVWYLFQFKRFNKIRKFDGKWVPKVIQNHPKSIPRVPSDRIFVFFMVSGGDWIFIVFSFGKKGTTILKNTLLARPRPESSSFYGFMASFVLGQGGGGGTSPRSWLDAVCQV